MTLTEENMITKDMLIADALKEGDVDAIANVLFSVGMHCLGCALAHNETVEDAANAHGIDVDELVEKLNEAAKG